ncbi:MAG TPA: hypothetical protein PKW82_08285, partial [Spirochaetales bacterium]|nr:hypothetical protein [Spirochaetales bacterium]
ARGSPGDCPVEAAFEGASVTGNVGLPNGVTAPGMPAALKVVYLLVMWVGRLEFMAVLALGRFVLSAFGRRRP